MAKQTYVAARDLSIEHKDYPAGTVIATVETPDGVPIDKALNAIARGFAKPADSVPAPAADAPPADAKAGKKGAAKAATSASTDAPPVA